MRFLNKLFFGIDFIFYTIFSYYYDNGKTNEKNYPPVAKTYFIFLLFFNFLLIGVYIISNFNVLEKNKPFLWGISAKIGTPICAIITYFVFYFNKRYLRIYERFRTNTFANNKNGKILGWTLFFLGLTSPFAIGYIRLWIYF